MHYIQRISLKSSRTNYVNYSFSCQAAAAVITFKEDDKTKS